MLVEQQVYADEADTQIVGIARQGRQAGVRNNGRRVTGTFGEEGAPQSNVRAASLVVGAHSVELVDQPGSRVDWTPVDRCVDEIVECSADREHVPCATRDRQRLLEHGDAP